MRHPVLVLCLCCAALLLGVMGTFAADPSAEPEDQAGCTGTCTTCPGKAKAMLEYAELKIALIEVAALKNEQQAGQVESRLGAAAGVAAYTAMVVDHAIWVAYDEQQASLRQLKEGLTALKLTPGREYLLAPLPKLKDQEARCVIYASVPPGSSHDDKVAQASAGLPELSAQRFDRMFNMLLVNYDIKYRLGCDAIDNGQELD